MSADPLAARSIVASPDAMPRDATSPTEPSGVTAPSGFVAAGVASGLKASGKPDLGLLVSDRPASAAGIFTTNVFAAAPVHACRRRLLDGSARAVVVNSGQANAGTGRHGAADAERVASAAAWTLGLDPRSVLPCSTGVIGARIPVGAAIAGVEAAAGSSREPAAAPSPRRSVRPTGSRRRPWSRARASPSADARRVRA